MTEKTNGCVIDLEKIEMSKNGVEKIDIKYIFKLVKSVIKGKLAKEKFDDIVSKLDQEVRKIALALLKGPDNITFSYNTGDYSFTVVRKVDESFLVFEDYNVPIKALRLDKIQFVKVNGKYLPILRRSKFITEKFTEKGREKEQRVLVIEFFTIDNNKVIILKKIEIPH